ncbi:DUF5681 domain-containing protein [Mesorhizobium sp. KR9-304]|uniref:DUF5681 domain-containing protein n=1 Tax=Mesorhizobium sp. KR9-304 TaxID=3156614 RepID=UPI0032B35FB6
MSDRPHKTPRDGAREEVGYGKPPLHSRFKLGQSGNPRGRPKGTKNLKTDLAEELAERVQVTENGRLLKISKQRLMLKALTTKAIKGDANAAKIVLNLIAQTIGLSQQDEAKTVLGEEDEAILSDWLAHASGGRRE